MLSQDLERFADIEYQAESPDEAALLGAARHAGCVLLRRAGNKVCLYEWGLEHQYTILAINAFTSARKCMSVLVCDSHGDISLWVKGADSAVAAMLADYESSRSLHASTLKLSTSGLRTLAVGSRILDEDTASEWLASFRVAQGAMSDSGTMRQLAREIETEVELLGVSGILDKLQEGAPSTIRRLVQAGIRVWMLTGDKRETAANIGASCGLVSNDCARIVLADMERRECIAALRDVCSGWLAAQAWEPGRVNRRVTLIIDGACVRHLLGGTGPGDTDSEPLIEQVIPFEDDFADKRIPSTLSMLSGQSSSLSQTGLRGVMADAQGIQRMVHAHRSGRQLAQRARNARAGAPKAAKTWRSLRFRTAARFRAARLATRRMAASLMSEWLGIQPVKTYSQMPPPSTESPTARHRRKSSLSRSSLSRSSQRADDSSGPLESQAARDELRAADDKAERLLAAQDAILDKLSPAQMLMAVASQCRSVIACRVSPLQKAQLTKLVKSGVGSAKPPLTVAVGDGGNDVTMIQEAHVGIGMRGQEGTQALRAADYVIGQFQHLERLILYHGRCNYQRTLKLVYYSFYKNSALVLTLFYFQWWAGNSGTTMFESWLGAGWNVGWTFLPIVVLGITDYDMDAQTVLNFPAVYRETRSGHNFSLLGLGSWMLNGAWHSFTVFGLMYATVLSAGRDSDGRELGHWACGSIVNFALVVLVNLKLFVSLHTVSVANLGATALSIFGWVLFAYLYGESYFYTGVSSFRDFAGVGAKILGTPLFWAAIPLGIMAALLPNIVFTAWTRAYTPDLFDILREWYLGYGTPMEPDHFAKELRDSQRWGEWARAQSLTTRRYRIGLCLRSLIQTPHAWKRRRKGVMLPPEEVKAWAADRVSPFREIVSQLDGLLAEDQIRSLICNLDEEEQHTVREHRLAYTWTGDNESIRRLVLAQRRRRNGWSREFAYQLERSGALRALADAVTQDHTAKEKALHQVGSGAMWANNKSGFGSALEVPDMDAASQGNSSSYGRHGLAAAASFRMDAHVHRATILQMSRLEHGILREASMAEGADTSGNLMGSDADETSEDSARLSDDDAEARELQALQGKGRNRWAGVAYMHPLSLKFLYRPRLEQQFMSQVLLPAASRLTRVALWLGSGFGAIYVAMELVSAGVTALVLLRAGMVISGAAMAACIHMPWFQRHFNTIMLCMAWLGGLGKTMIVTTSGAYGASLFPVTILLLLRLSFVGSVAVSVLDLFAFFVYSMVAQTGLELRDYALFAAVLLGFCLHSAHDLHKSARTSFLEKYRLKRELKRNQQVTYSLVPAHVALELVDWANDSNIAASQVCHNEDDVSVLFCDVVNFDQLMKSMNPEQLVHLLDKVYSLFDALSSKHGVTKIETVGKTYMACGGLQGSRRDHAAACVFMGLDMIRLLEQVSSEDGSQLVQVRLGIHSGPVLTGVVGQKKQQFSLFGDCVNTASRMQSVGVRGRINVSASTMRRLQGRFTLEQRQCAVKGKGLMRTYLVGEIVANVEVHRRALRSAVQRTEHADQRCLSSREASSDSESRSEDGGSEVYEVAGEGSSKDTMAPTAHTEMERPVASREWLAGSAAKLPSRQPEFALPAVRAPFTRQRAGEHEIPGTPQGASEAVVHHTAVSAASSAMAAAQSAMSVHALVGGDGPQLRVPSPFKKTIERTRAAATVDLYARMFRRVDM
jgi:magnesium-transporting ATPase (P-type)/class 3 adenylate cyclase